MGRFFTFSEHGSRHMLQLSTQKQSFLLINGNSKSVYTIYFATLGMEYFSYGGFGLKG